GCIPAATAPPPRHGHAVPAAATAVLNGSPGPQDGGGRRETRQPAGMARPPSVFLPALALCESDDVGPRTRVWAFAHILAGARVGADCNVGGHAFVEGGAGARGGR